MPIERRNGALPLAVLFVVASTPSASAGMTVYALSDVARMRLEDISFFVFILVVSSLLFRLLWNHAIKGFNFLPRLGFGQSFCLSLMFGLMMLLILTMISGIREVLTPAAWRKDGLPAQ